MVSLSTDFLIIVLEVTTLSISILFIAIFIVLLLLTILIPILQLIFLPWLNYSYLILSRIARISSERFQRGLGGLLNVWDNLRRNIRTSLISAFVALVVIGNIAVLLRLGIGGQDFFDLLFIYSLFGIPITFLVIGGAGGFVIGSVSALFILVLSLELGLYGSAQDFQWILISLAILVVFGYAVIFIQIKLKTVFMTQMTTLGDSLINLNSRLGLHEVNRLIDMITQANNELDTFFDIFAGGVIAAGSTVLALAFSPTLLPNENFKWMDAIQKAMNSIFIFYIGILILSIFLLRADDILRQVISQPPRLTLQNAIAMLLNVLGVGGLAILGVNFGMKNENPNVGVLCEWALRNIPQHLIPLLIFAVELVLGTAILAASMIEANKKKSTRE